MTTFTLGYAAATRKSGGLRQFILCRLSLMKQRKDLSMLDAERLKDIGISEKAARIEASRPIWDSPARSHH